MTQHHRSPPSDGVFLFLQAFFVNKSTIGRAVKTLFPFKSFYVSEKVVSLQQGFSKYKYMEQKRVTPERITELGENEVFVFGSNLAGAHGGGAALLAYRKFGAIWGQGVGLQGQSYGIPTMHGGVDAIKPYVDEFIEFAKTRPDLTFLVTRVGCGIAGFTNEEISPLFAKAHEVENIVLPSGW